MTPIFKVPGNPLINKSLRVLVFRGVGVVLLFAVTLFITNNFAEGLVGAFDVSRAYLFVVGSLCLIGMNQSVIYYSGLYTARESLGSIRQLYWKMLRILALSSVLLLLIFLVVPNALIDGFYQKPVSDIIFKTTVVLFFYGLTMLNIEMYRAIHRIETSEFIRNVLRNSVLLLAVVCIYYMGQEHLLVEMFLMSFVVVGLLSTLAVYRTVLRLKEATNPIVTSYREIVRRSFPMSVSFICFLLMQSIDILLLGKFRDYESVAFYSVAVKLTTIITLVLSSVNAVFAPKISELFSRGAEAALKTNIRSATRMIFVLTIPAILLLGLFSSQILALFGPNYVASNDALRILLFSQAINAACGSVGVYMNMTGNQRTFQRIVLSALVINLGLNWYLIPLYGMKGAAIATATSMIYWNIFAVVLLYKKFHIKTFLH